MDNRETLDRNDVIDTLGLLRHELVKATCLSWDTTTDFFEPLSYAVDKRNWCVVRMMSETDAYTAGLKAELIGDVLEKAVEMIDSYFESVGHKRGEQFKAREDIRKHDTIQRDDGGREGSGGGVQS